MVEILPNILSLAIAKPTNSAKNCQNITRLVLAAAPADLAELSYNDNFAGEKRVDDMKNGLDKVDMKILCVLQNKARTTNLELSRKISMSASACFARVQRLRNLGYIERDVSIIAATKLGPTLFSTLEVTLDSHDLKDHKHFEKAIQRVPEIVFAVKVSGRFDYLLAMATSDMQHLSRLSDELLDSQLGIGRLVTVPVLDVVKPFEGFPLQILTNPQGQKRDKVDVLGN
jgi:Lrp/AsnC family leucine-responsive transcriptional regulator